MAYRNDLIIEMAAGASMRLSLDRAREMLRTTRRAGSGLHLRRDRSALYHALSAATIAELDALLGGDGVPPDAW